MDCLSPLMKYEKGTLVLPTEGPGHSCPLQTVVSERSIINLGLSVQPNTLAPHHSNCFAVPSQLGRGSRYLMQLETITSLKKNRRKKKVNCKGSKHAPTRSMTLESSSRVHVVRTVKFLPTTAATRRSQYGKHKTLNQYRVLCQQLLRH
jgi:hypothetical protein